MIVIAFIGGLSLALGPAILLHFSLTARGFERIFLYIAAAAVAVISLIFLLNSFWVGLIGFVIGAVFLYTKDPNRSRSEVILEDSVDPKINAELERISLEVKKSDSPKENQKEVSDQSQSLKYTDIPDLTSEKYLD